MTWNALIEVLRRCNLNELADHISTLDGAIRYFKTLLDIFLLYYYANVKLNASGYKNVSISTTHVQKCQDTFIQYYGIPSNIV